MAYAYKTNKIDKNKQILSMDTAAAHLMDFSKPFDTVLLDQIVDIAFDGSNVHRAAANEFLIRMKDHPEMWKRVGQIIDHSRKMSTKFFGLQVLSEAINTRWKIIPIDQREGIRNFTLAKIIDICNSEESIRSESTYLNRLNLVLVQILKQDWPDEYPTFIEDIVTSSKSSELYCENNMVILKLLSEEIFDFSKDAMTSTKIKHMKESMNEYFSQIFSLCEFILGATTKPSLLNASLQTLQRYLSWIPLGYIFETSLLSVLITKFFPIPLLRTNTIDCLTEVANLATADITDTYIPVLQQMIVLLSQQLAMILPITVNLIDAYENGSEEDCCFIQRLALFLSSFFTNHLKTIQRGAPVEVETAIADCLNLMIRVSEVKDEEVFKVCLDFWQYFCKDLYTSNTQWRAASGSGSFLGRYLGKPSHPPQFDTILHNLRKVMIDRMAKPEEVLIVEDDNGEIVRELAKDTEVIAQYKTMRETIVYMTHLNYDDTEAIMLEKLDLQVGQGKFSWNGLNTLCWAIGSISGAMGEMDEKRFLVTVIKDLLRLCEEQRGKDNKAVVASNIMYIVGQYPRFLRAHWKFLKTVVNKLFEFMHECHPGVQDMACDTFLKIAQKCKRKFMTIQAEETVPFVFSLISDLHHHVSELQPHQVQVFYEAVACMLSDRGATMTSNREEVLGRLMSLPNSHWKVTMSDAALDIQSLYQFNNIKEISKIVRTNTRVCSAAGAIFTSQLSTIFLDLLNIYHLYSEQINQACQLQGEIATRLTQYKAMRGVKSDILELLQTYLEMQQNPEEYSEKTCQMIMKTMIPPVMREVLPDYKVAPPSAKDPRVLLLFATAISTLRSEITPEIPTIMDAIFESTLDLITKNMMDYPEHRTAFFKYLRAANEHCFFGLFSISPPHQKLVVDSIIWAIKHTERNISETGLEILFELLQKLTQTPEFSLAFYQTFMTSLIQNVLEIVTDRLHKSGFRLQTIVLKHIFSVVLSGEMVVPLFETTPATSHPSTIVQENQTKLKEYVANLILTAFPNLTRTQVIAFVMGLFDISMDLNAFKQHLRDFLITTKEFQEEDNADIFREERDAEREMNQLKEWEYRRSVPGLLHPSEVDTFGDSIEDTDI